MMMMNQPQLKRDTRANAKIKFCVYKLNQWLNEYTVAGSLSVGASYIVLNRAAIST